MLRKMSPKSQAVETVTKESLEDSTVVVKEKFKQKLIPKYVIYAVCMHLAAIYGIYLGFTQAKWATILFEFFLYHGACIGVTAGNHRLYSHRSYKAKAPLHVILTLLAALAFHYSSISWVRDHRIHHKYVDSDADPHNARRGFFYSHIGWLFVTQHPDVKRKGKSIDLSDVYNNPIVRFQHDHIALIGSLTCFVLPTVIPMFWSESLSVALHLAILRFILCLHAMFCINSVTHKWGNKPYDKNLLTTQSNPVSFFNSGEGFHNYHHVFPFDYRAAELGNNKLNLATKFIDFFAWIGWAYDLKSAPEDMIRERMKRTGDGTDLWGY